MHNPANDNPLPYLQNAMVDWQRRGAIQDSGLDLKIINYGEDGFSGKGGFFPEVAVIDSDGCQWAQFVGPFSKLNALRFLNTYTLSGSFHA